LNIKMHSKLKSAVQLVHSGIQVVRGSMGDQTSQPCESVVDVNKLGGRSMIGPDVKIQGKLVSDEDLVIQGQVKGSIRAKAKHVTVGVNGQLNADILANRVKIEGAVVGDIIGGEKVIIAKTGNVIGNIQAPRVNLEDGAKFKGSIEMDPQAVVPAGFQATPKTETLE